VTVARSNQSRPLSASDGAPIRGLLPLMLGLILWQAFAAPNSPYFPPPLEWIHALQGLAKAGRLWPAIATTVTHFALALLINVLLGSALGIVLGRSRTLDRLLGPLLEFARTMPAGALVPVAVLIMGYTSSMTLAVVVFTSFWPILLNARAGAAGVSQDRLDTARALQLSWWATQWKILLPSVVPSIRLGTQIAAPITLIIVLLVEILTQVSGIGRQIALSQSVFRSANVYGLVAMTGCLGLVVNWLIVGLGRLTRRYDLAFNDGGAGR
jgi:sulfonate transport system permease protein